MKRKSKECEKCGILIIVNNYTRHYNSCGNKERLNIADISRVDDKTGNHVCCICDKLFSYKGIATHYWRMHTAAGHSHKHNFRYSEERVAWNKGLTKDTSSVIMEQSLNASERVKLEIINGNWVNTFPPMTDVQKQHKSERMSLNNPGGRCKWYTVDGIKVQGTYEKQFAEALTEGNILWERITKDKIMKYDDKSYTADFYLPKYMLYVEIKGYWWNQDRQKMLRVKELHSKYKNLILLYGASKLNEICKNTDLLFDEPLWQI